MPAPASPASNGGRGLKQLSPTHIATALTASPASNGGRGLKQVMCGNLRLISGHRPPAMAGAD